MVPIKSSQDLKKMQEGGKILAAVLSTVLENIKPGVSEKDLEEIAVSEIKKAGGAPSFKMVPGYKHALCISTNDVIVHGIPGNYKFKEGDVVGIDCGVFYKGFHTDMSDSIIVRAIDVRTQTIDFRLKQQENDLFLDTGIKALEEAIKEAKIGNRVGNISKKIQSFIEGAGYSVVKVLVGHGVGKELHEEPEIPGFLDKTIDRTPVLKEGMTIAIEVIYNKGKSGVEYGDDGWTIRTQDHQISGLFERTVAITKNGPLILTN